MYSHFMMIGDRWAARHNVSRPKTLPAPTRPLLPAPAAARKEAGQ